jgi:hypothetical protein
MLVGEGSEPCSYALIRRHLVTELRVQDVSKYSTAIGTRLPSSLIERSLLRLREVDARALHPPQHRPPVDQLSRPDRCHGNAVHLSVDDVDEPRQRDLVADLVELLRSLPAGEIVQWGTETAEDDGWIDGWCDVWAPSLARPLGLSWVWTVTATEAEDPGPLYLPLPGEARSDDGDPGWPASSVSRVLEAWVAQQASRPDIIFVFTPGMVSDWIAAVIGRIH